MTISENISLAPYTTFKIGGLARYFCAAKSEADLAEALKFAREKELPAFILGGGSNLLVSDAGFAGLVIKMEMAGTSFDKASPTGDIVVTAQAGESWDDLVAETVERGAWGLENLSAIPGTVGAAPVQNIGAYGVEVESLIESVRAVDRETGAARTFANSECRFSYRDSFFKSPEGKKYAIVSVSFRLSSKPRPNLSYKDLREAFAGATAAGRSPSQGQIRDTVTKIRAGKFPDVSPSSPIGTAGSFWKNPIIDAAHFAKLKTQYPEIPSFAAPNVRFKVPLAWILDKACGLKGYTVGKVGLYQNQPLVLVAEKGATAESVQKLSEYIAGAVKAKTGIDIEPEVGFLAELMLE